MTELAEYLPFWTELTADQQALLDGACTRRHFPRGTVIHNGREDCVGLLLVLSGQLRVYTVYEEGRELTLFRLLERDLCLLSASCILRSIQFDVTVAAQQDTWALHIPADVYQRLMRVSAAVAGYTNELMAARFTDVMWLMDQILNRRMDSRLAAFLLEQSDLEETDRLRITQEQIAGNLGTAREVVTRMLGYLRSEGLAEPERGGVRLLDRRGLEALAGFGREKSV